MGTCWVLSSVFPLLKYAFNYHSGSFRSPDWAWYSPSRDQLRSLYWAESQHILSLSFPSFPYDPLSWCVLPHPLIFCTLTSCIPYPDPIMRLRTLPQHQSPQSYAWSISSTGVLGSVYPFCWPCLFPFLFTSSLAFFWVIFITLLFLLLTWSHISIIFMVTLKITTWVCKLPMFHVGQDCPLLSNMSPESILLTPWNYMLLGMLVLHSGPNRKLFNAPLSLPSFWLSLCSSLLSMSGTRRAISYA